MAKPETRDRIAAEQLARLAVVFPQLTTLCDRMAMDSVIAAKPKPVCSDTEHAALLTSKGMHLTQPTNRKRA